MLLLCAVLPLISGHFGGADAKASPLSQASRGVLVREQAVSVARETHAAISVFGDRHTRSDMIMTSVIMPNMCQ